MSENFKWGLVLLGMCVLMMHIPVVAFSGDKTPIFVMVEFYVLAITVAMAAHIIVYKKL